MKTPRKLNVNKPVKLIFTGGFLGSGKTTALGALAKRIMTKGLRLGIITNDQSGNLADTLIAQAVERFRNSYGHPGTPVLQPGIPDTSLPQTPAGALLDGARR
ncbi:MAG: GTP-binding protein [Deltaproteobacteria bacterium]|nr:GTP-binding protein [Deltaproteobacteria bacterium]